jgi:hypothetical protein
MITLQVQIGNLDQIKRGHDVFLARNERLIVEANERAGRHAEDHVKRYATFKRRSGQLQDKTTHRLIRTSGGRILRISNPKRYAAAIDTGARRHIIRPRRKKFLRFYSAKLGRFVYARKVNHPGNKPYKFLFRATTSAHRVLGQDLQRGMSELARRF